jgi:hypothetical protein
MKSVIKEIEADATNLIRVSHMNDLTRLGSQLFLKRFNQDGNASKCHMKLLTLRD